MTMNIDRVAVQATAEVAEPSLNRAVDRRARAMQTLRRLTGMDVFALLVLSLLPIALLPGFYDAMHTRRALAFAALPLGAWLLGRRVVRRDPSAVAALSFVLVAAIAASASGPRWPTMMFGSTGVAREMSVLALIAAFGWWAIGRALSFAGSRVLPIALTAAGAVNVAVGAGQLIFQTSGGLYSSFSGRLTGLMSNPVYFASTFIGVWAYWLVVAGRPANRFAWAASWLLAAAVAASGSRGATALGLLLCALHVAVRRTRASMVASGVSLLGFAAGIVTIALASPSQPDRLGEVDAGISVRLRMWTYALRAWSERPLIGWGPDPYQEAMSSHVTTAEVRRDGLSLIWHDPHNVVVYVLVSVGIIGAGCLIGFIVAGLRGRIDWPLLVAAVTITLSWMLQPIMSNGWPIAFALFGASVRPHGVGPDRPHLSSRATKILSAIGVTIALAFLVWSARLHSALSDRDADQAEHRAGFLIQDPTVAMSVAWAHVDSVTGPPSTDRHMQRAEELAGMAARRGGEQLAWRFLIETQLARGNPDAAIASALEGIEVFPNSPMLYDYLRVSASEAEEDEIERMAIEKMCEFGSPMCEEWRRESG